MNIIDTSKNESAENLKKADVVEIAKHKELLDTGNNTKMKNKIILDTYIKNNDDTSNNVNEYSIHIDTGDTPYTVINKHILGMVDTYLSNLVEYLDNPSAFNKKENMHKRYSLDIENDNLKKNEIDKKKPKINLITHNTLITDKSDSKKNKYPTKNANNNNDDASSLPESTNNEITNFQRIHNNVTTSPDTAVPLLESNNNKTRKNQDVHNGNNTITKIPNIEVNVVENVEKTISQNPQITVQPAKQDGGTSINNKKINETYQKLIISLGLYKIINEKKTNRKSTFQKKKNRKFVFFIKYLKENFNTNTLFILLNKYKKELYEIGYDFINKFDLKTTRKKYLPNKHTKTRRHKKQTTSI